MNRAVCSFISLLNLPIVKFTAIFLKNLIKSMLAIVEGFESDMFYRGNLVNITRPQLISVTNGNSGNSSLLISNTNNSHVCLC